MGGGFFDTVAYFSWNPAGLFSKEGKGHIAGASDYSGKKKDESGNAPSTTPEAPKPEASLVEAQTEVDKKRKIIAQTGGQTQQTSPSNSYIQTNQVKLKTLLGGTQ